MITEDYVSFEIAKLLKEKGFVGECFFCWDNVTETNRISSLMVCSNKELVEHYYAMPTLQMAMKWLREEHAIIIELHHQHRKEWYAIISSENPLGIGVYTTSTFNTYEEACEAAIKYCLENLA